MNSYFFSANCRIHNEGGLSSAVVGLAMVAILVVSTRTEEDHSWTTLSARSRLQYDETARAIRGKHDLFLIE